MTRALLLLVGALSLACVGAEPPPAADPPGPRVLQNVVVYYEPGRFAGWPANNGLWSWGDEILVGFSQAYYEEQEDRHSIDRDRPHVRVMARSLDGGLTWNLETPDVFDGVDTAAKAGPEHIDFADPDFALTVRWQHYHLSDDRGRTWSEAYLLPDFGQHEIHARTDYLVEGPDSCLLFLTATKTNGREGRPFVARMRGGDDIQFVSWIAPEPEGYSIMPSTVRLSGGELLSAIRRYERGEVNRGWIETWLSEDGGQSWTERGHVAETGGRSGNPPSMIRLSDGRLVVTYGYRSPPYGIRARISGDEGETWGDEIPLRTDTRTWDIGYTRSVQRRDGKIVTIYYHTTEKMREQHIAATIWDPGPSE
jgi:hypothetical protein